MVLSHFFIHNMSFKSLDTIFKTVDPQDFHQDRCSGRGVAHRFRDLD